MTMRSRRSGVSSLLLTLASAGALAIAPAVGTLGCSGSFTAGTADTGTGGDDQANDAGGDSTTTAVPPPDDSDAAAHKDGQAHKDVETDATTDEGVDATVDAGTDANVAADAVSDVTIGAPDVTIVVDASTCNDTVDENAGIFVSPGGAAAACGSKSVPCSSVQTALGLAVSTGKSIVYLDEGTYNESVSLVPGVTLQGGWNDVGGTWKHQCSGDPATSAVIAAPASANVTVSANGFSSGAAAATLDTLTVRSKAAASPAESLIGILAGPNANLILNHVEISVAAGGKGIDGGLGTAGSGSVACGGTTPGDGAVGTGGGAGNAGSPVACNGSGCATAVAGGGNPGAPGSNGNAAAAGLTAVCAQCGVEPNCCGPEEGCTKPVCAPKCYVDTSLTVTGTAGQSGCGGNPGAGGTGGQGGGSSIGILAWGAMVTVNEGAIGTGGGGAGGAGGGGGAGAAGTLGAAGTGSCQDSTCVTNGSKCTAGATHNLGTSGTQGGTGGQGGQGGGGAGGDSFAYYQGNGGAVSVNGTSIAAGAAGGGGAPNGAAGQSAAHN